MIDKIMDKKHVSNRRKKRAILDKICESNYILHCKNLNENNNTVMKYMYIHFGLSLEVLFLMC